MDNIIEYLDNFDKTVARARNKNSGPPGVQIKLLDPKATIPKYATEGASGFDIRAVFDGEDVIVYAGKTWVFNTGLAFKIPDGYELQIRPRSGIAFKHSITVLNSPGTLDSDFLGELKILLINHGDNPFKVQSGNRIAQGVIAPVIRVNFELVDKLPETVRGTGGFGSTGIK